jgi:Ca-activated chloride channel family protein
MKLSAQFDFSKVDHTKDNTVHLLIAARAPALDWMEQRPRVFILPVIDVSGSMKGKKLEYAKQACRKLVEQLRPGDCAGLITFSSRARVVVAPAEVSADLKMKLAKAIDGLREAGGTNFSEAIGESLKVMGALDLPRSVQHRIIFFTDGQPTEGLTEPRMIKELVSQNLGALSMSFFGYGEGSDTWGGCDQTLLTELSQLGRGNYAYVQNPDDALAAFGKELGGLLSTYASDLTVTVEPKNGHVISRVVTDVKVDDTDVMGITTFDLDNILAEETRHIVVECVLKAQDKAFPRQFTIFDVKATFRRVTPQGLQDSEEVTTSAKAEFVRESEAQRAPTAEVDSVVTLHKMAQTQKAAEVEAEKGNYGAAEGLLRSFANEVKTRGYVAIGEASSALAGGFSNAERYVQTQGMRRSMHRGVTRSTSVSSYDSDAAAVLSECSVNLANSAQANFSASFMSDGSAPSNPSAAPLVPPRVTNGTSSRLVVQQKNETPQK